MMRNRPNFAIRLLRWICKASVIEEIEGDLLELHEKQARRSNHRAYWRLVWNVLRSIRWINIKRPQLPSTGMMLGNHLKVSYRSLRKDFAFTSINLIGLCIGLSVFIVMTLIIAHEHSFDRFHSKSDRVFEVIQVFSQADGEDPEIWTSRPLAAALEEELPYVEKAVSLFGAASNWVEANDQRYFEEEGIIADPGFFDLFDFELVAGDKRSVMQSKRSTVISEQLANKYFGNQDPLGQTITHDFYGPFTVTGVLKKIPANSYVQFDYILTPDFDEYFNNVASWFPGWFQSWSGDPAATFVLLSQADHQSRFEADAKILLEKYQGTDEVNRHYLLNLEDLHFGSNGIDGRINAYVKGDEMQVKLFGFVALLILLMACANYINITTARSEKRHKEVGIRKTIGAMSQQLVLQFLTESFLLVGLSIVLATVIAYLLLPYFQLITGIGLEWDWEQVMDISPYLLATLLSVTLLAGWYPAIVLSRPKAISILRGKPGGTKKSMGLRSFLLVCQFGLVVALSSGLLIVYEQYEYLTDKSLGYNTEHLAVIEINSGPVRENYQLLKGELLQIPGVLGVTGLTRMFSGYRSGSSIEVGDTESPDELRPMTFYGMDEDGIDNLGLRLLMGTGFQGRPAADRSSVLLNETAAQAFGRDMLGQWVEVAGEGEPQFRAQVIGIVQDFHFESLHEPIKPAVIGYYLNPIMGLDDIVVRISGQQMPQTMEAIEAIHHHYDTNDVMTWEFLDDMTQHAYENELKFQRIFTGAAVLSLCIALLGLVGLIAYSSVARAKEFGIRKVLGARFADIFRLQSRAFLRYALFASLLAVPICWWASLQWLQTYAYRIDLSPFPFVTVIFVVLFATLTTAFIMGKEAASRNPVDALRCE